MLDGLLDLKLGYIRYFKKGLVWISKGLHIDSYKKIKYIDGYKINLINFEKNKIYEKHLKK